MHSGHFIISLDFELMWGVRDSQLEEQYGKNILAVHKVLPKLLALFNQYDIKSTIAVVGFLFYQNKYELENNLPDKKPNYSNKGLSPYTNSFNYINDDDYYFAQNLIKQIRSCPQHEIATHTYSHYYCLEKGQTAGDFKEDLQQAIKVANRKEIQIKSIIFPRNQYSDEYLSICKKMGIHCYRGNESHWCYNKGKVEGESILKKAIRLLDSYVNISGYNCYSEIDMQESILVNIPSSRFLRPYSTALQFLEPLRLRRIIRAMTYAAKNNLAYHLWWHPHNFGSNQSENFSFLKKILMHHKKLNHKFGFQSTTMSEFRKSLKTSNG